jgi:iron complex transport system substrate-binding protein
MIRWAGVVALAMLALGPAAPAAALTVTDQTGRTVTLAAPPRRIVSLVPGVTEMLFAIGAEEKLIGVTDFCDFPAAARRKPRVGSMLAPSLETVVALQPDLVVATDSGNSDETRVQLERLRLPVYLVSPRGVADVFRTMEQLGTLTGQGARAGEAVAGLQRRVRAVVERVAARPRPRVLYVVWPEPLIVPGRGAAVSELIELAGGASVTADAAEGYPRWSVEAAVAGAPELIVLARHGAGTGPVSRDKWERFAGLPAIRTGRIHNVDGDLFHRFGPRVVDALEILARLVHPEAFAQRGQR